MGRSLFDLAGLRTPAMLLVLGGTVLWFLLVRTVWKRQLLQRFVAS